MKASLPDDPRPAGRFTTAADVARAAGVSVSTVQCVFNRPARISAQTQERVRQTAETLGYSPSATGRALRTGRLNTSSLVLPANRLDSEYITGTFSGYYHALADSEIDVMVSLIPEDVSPDKWLLRLAGKRRCDSMAVFLEHISPESLAVIQALRLPVTMLFATSLHGFGPSVSAVGFDNYGGMQQVVRYLAELGHRQIAYFGAAPGWPDASDRERGFRTTMAEVSLEVKEPWIVSSDELETVREMGCDTLTRIFTQPGVKPTAIVCFNDTFARSVINAAPRWGKSVPSDISVTGFDNDSWTPYHNPAVTTVGFSGRKIGETAAQLVLERYEDATKPGRTVILPTYLVVRASTAPPATL